jgi:hypothetical protein
MYKSRESFAQIPNRISIAVTYPVGGMEGAYVYAAFLSVVIFVLFKTNIVELTDLYVSVDEPVYVKILFFAYLIYVPPSDIDIAFLDKSTESSFIDEDWPYVLIQVMSIQFNSKIIFFMFNPFLLVGAKVYNNCNIS